MHHRITEQLEMPRSLQKTGTETNQRIREGAVLASSLYCTTFETLTGCESPKNPKGPKNHIIIEGNTTILGMRL